MVKASLFMTCVADTIYPDVGEHVYRLLRRHGVSLDFPTQQTCCGQPMYNAGYKAEARRLALHFVETFERSEYVVTPSGSCAAMVRYTYPQLFEDDPATLARVRAVTGRVFEFSQFMVDVLGLEDLGARHTGRATYHRSCHMTRELGVTEQPVRLLKRVVGLEYVEMERADLCCGFGGTFAVKMPEVSCAMADEKLGFAVQTGASMVVGSDLACLMNLEGRARRQGIPLRFLHLATLLAEGVGLA